MRFLPSISLILCLMLAPHSNARGSFAFGVATAAVDDGDFVIANDDNATTDEDTDITFDILSNDAEVLSSIDPSTVDLDPGTAGFQTDVTTTEGTFKYDGSGNIQFSPAPNYFGTASITYTVDDNFGATSNAATIEVTINPVNDPPIINGQTPATLLKTEDVNFTITTSDLSITDVDDASFTVVVMSGTNYTFSGATVTPAANYNGPLTVNVKVNDGDDDSNVLGVAVDVAAVNDAPVIASQTPATILATEDVNFSLSLANFNINDVEGGSYSLTVLPGSNYTFNGLTITPNPNYNGPLSVNVTVSDGTDDSDPFATAVSVAAVNDEPVITAQSPATISATEDVNFNVSLANITVVDPDDGSFTFTVLPGTNYSFTGTTITPATNYNGPLTVNVKVNDGDADSDPFGLSVSVTAVNDAPSITGQTPAILSATEDTDFSIAISNLVISDPDNSSFTLSVLSGTNYTFSGTTITPAADYSGPLTVNVTVSDGTNTSTPFGVDVNVSGDNDAPIITGQTPATLSATEDTNFSITLGNLVISDPDNSSFTLTVLSGTNYTFSGTTVTPASNYSGPLTVNVRVSDGTNNSNTFGVAVNVAAVNDPPSITGQTPATMSATEDTNFNISIATLVISDVDNSSFTLTVLAGTDYTFSGTTITPETNHNGPLTVNVQVSDGTNTSNTFGVAVNVAAVNDTPVITGQTPATISAVENTNFNVSLANLVISDPDNSSFTMTVLSGTNYTFSGLTITPANDYNGPLTVNVRVTDGTNTSATFGLAVSVGAVNDPPVITGQNPATLSATEDTNFNISVSNLIITDPDNSSFTLTVLAGTNYTFSGTTITPAANHNGPLSVNVQVSDGTNTSNTFGVAVNVAAVNDVPVITGQTPAAIAATEDTNFNITLSNLIIADPDNASFTLTVLPGTNYTFSGSTITPAANYTGALTVNVTVNDGTNTSVAYGVAVNVSAANDKPVITGQTPATIAATEDTNFSISLANMVIVDPDNASFTLTILPGTNYTFVGTTITPSANHTGALTVNVKVNDGTLDSDPFGVAVNVSAVNDVPSITGQTPLPISATEDQAFSLTVSNLIISDPDNASFTLTVLAGTNYTFSGTTITPASNFTGTLTVNVRVNDGTNDSAPFGVTVNVSGGNDAPTITGQTPTPIAATEDQNFSISLSNLVISDPDNTSFTLTILAGTNYTFSGTTVTPAPNFSGALTVNVKVSDGTADSPTFGVSVNVAPVNDIPVITGQAALTTNEETQIVIALSNLNVTDPDNTYPTGFTLSLAAGANYTVTSGNRITPAANFNGTLTVPVTVNDGTNNSGPFNLQITVTPVNDVPVITAQSPLSTGESQPITLALSQLVVSDPDNAFPDDFTLFVLSGSNYTLSGNEVTPNANFSGNLIVRVFVSDGTANSAIYNLQIQVNSVNNVPVITGQKPLSLNEDNSIVLKLNDLTVTDPDNNFPADFTLKVSDGANYSVTNTTVTPDANFNGTLVVSVVVNDGNVDSAPFNLQITVNPVNDAPVITGQQPLSTNEDTSISIQFANLTVTDPDDTYPTDFTMSILSGTNYTFSGTTVTPAAEFSGTLTVQVRVNDGTVNSATFPLQITVNAVNDAPAITGQQSLSVSEDNAVTIQLSNLVVLDPDDGFPSGFTLTVLSTSNGTISGNTITPAANFNGTITASVKVNDGTVDSAPHNITITVSPVNDLPVFVSTPGPDALLATVGEPYEYLITVTDVDGDAITFPTAAPTSKPSWATLTVTGPGKARLSGTPTAVSAGTFEVKLRAKDPTGSPIEQSFTLIINTRPVVSAFELVTNEDTNINFTASLFAAAFTDADADNLTKVKITKLPKHGSIKLGSNAIVENEEVAAAAISQLVYTPALNYFGQDTLYWNANDGHLAYSKNPTHISFVINPINDAPVITLETDTLKYEIGKGLVHLTTTFNITDVDDDSLTSAEVAFRQPQQKYKADVDVITFTNTDNITGVFDIPSGVLTLTGHTTLEEYAAFMKTIEYRYTNTANPKLESKSIYFTASDGKSLSNTADRLIQLIYTFQDLDIVNGFTPNGDGHNDVWEVIKPERKEDLKESRTAIYDVSGKLIFEAVGFEDGDLWDGTYKGKTVPQGSYFFTIEVVDSKLRSLRKVYKGVVNVLY